MLMTVTFVALTALALLLVYAAMRPDTFRVQRTTVIKAPASKIFALINDLKSFNNWNPFEKKDPSVTGRYSGAASGVGAVYAWSGRKVGAGHIEITASVAPSQVTMRLDSVKPLKRQNTVEFTLQARGDTITIVTWALQGPSPYLSRLIGVAFDAEARIGKDFEAGLANLKALTEAR